MPFTIVRDDITHVRADALVNAANERLQRGGGVCGALFRAAGAARLQDACDKIGHCDTGDAVATPAFNLPARYIIHAVGPIWRGGSQGERALLASCYRRSLELAASLKCRSVAFPLISAGIYGYPTGEALQVAQDEIKVFLQTHEMQVTLVLFGSRSMELADELHLRVARYIDDVYVAASGHHRREGWESAYLQEEDTGSIEALNAPWPAAGQRPTGQPPAAKPPAAKPPATQGDYARRTESYPGAGRPVDSGTSYGMPAPSAPSAAPAPLPRGSSAREGKKRIGLPRLGKRDQLPHPLKSLLAHLDAGFSQTLLTLIDERGLKDAEVYKKANISRQHFSKIRSNPSYKPTKTTVLALAVALELSLSETQMLLERAGFALSHADCRDVIVEFFIREGIYDVYQINDALFAFDQPLLG